MSNQKRILLIIAHAAEDESTHNHKLAQSVREALKLNNIPVRTIDLMKDGFSHQMSKDDFTGFDATEPFNAMAYQASGRLAGFIKAAQAKIEWCTHIIIFGPIWYYRLPAILQSFLERVFTVNWAFSHSKPPQEMATYGKYVMFVITTGGPMQNYEPGCGISSLEGLLFNYYAAFNHFGMIPIRCIPLFHVFHMKPEDFEQTCEKLSKAILEVEKRPIIDFAANRSPGTDVISYVSSLPPLLL